MRLGAVIAAAGLSSRMGAFKPLLPLGDSTMIGQVIAAFQGAGVAEIVVVTGHRARELESALSGTGVTFVRNPRYAVTEMFDSAVLGFRALTGRCDALFFTPGDIPLFSVETLKALAASGAPAAVPVWGGHRGHPLYLTAGTAALLAADEGAGGLRGALGRCGVAVGEIPVEDEGILLDADTREAYLRLKERI